MTGERPIISDRLAFLRLFYSLYQLSNAYDYDSLLHGYKAGLCSLLKIRCKIINGKAVCSNICYTVSQRMVNCFCDNVRRTRMLFCVIFYYQRIPNICW